MKVAIVYNARPDIEREDPKLEKEIEGDEWKTTHSIGEAAESNGHKVTYYPINPNIYEELRKAKDKIDLVFNLSEGINGSDREAQIPMICEVLGIPYSGPGPLSAALILNKARAKEIWKVNGIRTADWQLFKTGNETLKSELKFPVIVKPNSEGSGIGIKNNAVTKNTKELKANTNHIIKGYNQSALVEEFLPGREFTIGLIGNGDDLITLPIVEINFAGLPKGIAPIDSYEAKFIYGATGVVPMHETEFCPAKIGKKLENEIVNIAKDAYNAVGCQDFARIDMRLGKNGKVYVMEINHPPGLMSDENESSFFTIEARAAGLTFDQTIGRILSAAIKRLNLK